MVIQHQSGANTDDSIEMEILFLNVEFFGRKTSRFSSPEPKAHKVGL